jgi:cellulose synthase (UDP-forming)
MIEIPRERRRAYLRNCRILAVVATIFAALYLKWLLFDTHPVSRPLYVILVAAEVFNIVQAAGFWYTISRQKWSEPPAASATGRNLASVDVFVTVCGEPFDVVEQTLASAMAIRYPRKRVHVLDDGGDPAVKRLAQWHGAGYIHRATREGGKAGNVNHALSLTDAELFAIFDADQAPRPEFLDATVAAFADPSIAFVQTPQVYRNRATNRVAKGAHDQQQLFYGPIMRGKNGCGAVFSCGSNVVFRRSAIRDLGDLPEDSITEDLRTSLLLVRHRYKSVYVSRVLADGLGPMDVASFFSQQLRWGRGGLEILLRRRPYSRHMTLDQAIQYSLGFLYWFTGWAYLGYLVLPIMFLLRGLQPIQVPNDYPAHFLPYALTSLATIAYSSDFQMRFDGLWFTLASFPVQVKMLMTALFAERAHFVVTPKRAVRASLRPVRWHLLTMGILLGSALVGIVRYGADPSMMNNIAWIVAHIVILQGFVALTLRPEVPSTRASERERRRVLREAEAVPAPAEVDAIADGSER